MSANQVADNAAFQAQEIYKSLPLGYNDTCFYPPFSSRWNFSVKGCLTNKGATKEFFKRMDEELSFQQKHRPKQGLIWHTTPYNSLSFNQIGDESLLKNLTKMNAPCWIRCIYRYPPLVNQTWQHWRKQLQNTNVLDFLSVTVPKDWRKNPEINNKIIKACPFCLPPPNGDSNLGNLEHRHLYCSSNHLQKARHICNQELKKRFSVFMIMQLKENIIDPF